MDRAHALHGDVSGDHRTGAEALLFGRRTWPTLVRTLLREALIDELRLMIEPVILGGGKTIFPDDGALRTLELVSTATSRTGVHEHVCTYRPFAER